MEENDALEKAGCIGIGFSFLFPIVGIIMFFVQKNQVENSSAYLVAVLIGIALNLIFRVAVTS